MGFHAASLLISALTVFAAPQEQPADTEQVHYLGVPSDLLAEFHGRETLIEAGVVLPTDYQRGERIPVVYHVHGFGGTHRGAWRSGPRLIESMDSGAHPRMLHVYLNAKCALGHHVFADSVNTGPWASALVEEFIPAFEQKYGVVGGAQARFLTGHSSGGWSTFWLQVDRPDDFNGTWSTAPDPVDFRDFTGVDIYSFENAYVDPAGDEIQLMRRGDEWVASIREFVARELERQGHFGGQFASFDAVFSPRGEDGQPMPLFDRETGVIDPAVAQAWQKYDIRLLLERRWESLGPRLQGKLHLFCGTLDTFRLEGAAYLLRDAMAELGSDAEFHFSEGRTHGNLFAPDEELWPDGLMTRIFHEMQARFDETADRIWLGAPERGNRSGLRPNVVLILADDLGWGDIQAMNSGSRIPTPHLNELAAEGMRFTDAHSPSAVCTPTRYALLTGRYAWRTRLKSGVLWGADRLLIEPERRTIAGMLQDAGYATAVIGKWHLGLGAWSDEAPAIRTDFSDIDAGPHTIGFGESLVIPASLDIPPYAWIRNGVAEALPDTDIEGSTRWWQGGEGFWRAGKASADFDHHDVLPRIGREAVSWLEDRAMTDDGKPFFLYLPLASPHTPWLPAEEWVGKSGAGPYGDFVAQTDDVVGQVLAALDAEELSNTIVIFTSDNGAHWRPQDSLAYLHSANGGLRGMKADIEEAGHRVPMLVRWPLNVRSGSTCDATVGLHDWYATMADLLGQPLKTNEAEDSTSMASLLWDAGQGRSRLDLVHHSINGSFAIRQGRWKLIEGLGSGGFTPPKKVAPAEGEDIYRLYDLDADLQEQDDLSEVYPEVVERLRKRLETVRAGS